MRRFILFTVITATAAAVLLSLSGDTNAQATNIDVGNFYFCSLASQDGVCDTTVSPGSTVTWEVSSGIHTVTQCDASFTTCPPPGGFDSGTLSVKGGTYSQTFNTPGTYPYRCNFHPTDMRGRILVQAQPTATPAPTASPVAGIITPTLAPTLAAGAATPTPAAVPSTGGDSGGGPGSLFVAILVALGTLSLVAVGAGLLALRRTTD